MGYAKKIKFLFTCFYYICSILVIYKRYVILSKKGVGLSNQVYEIIKQRLITCEYKPNSVLNEAQLSAELGCSRTPTREAIIQLERQGFLQIIPKKGIYVTAITANEIMQIFQARKEIEPVALRMGRATIDTAILEDFKIRFSKDTDDVLDGYKLDTAMHMYFIENCGNDFIIDMMHSVFDKNTRVIIASKENQLHVNESRKEHLEIINLLINGDYDTACKKLSEHIDHCRIAALESFYSANTGPREQTYKKYLMN